jgi:Ca2+-binding EF-hand superfamily protein
MSFTQEQEEVLKETFDLYQKKSKNGVNSISLNEFQLAYQFLTGKQFSKEQVSQLKTEILQLGAKQEDSVLQITFEIFKGILAPRMKNSDSEIIQELFQYFDVRFSYR